MLCTCFDLLVITDFQECFCWPHCLVVFSAAHDCGSHSRNHRTHSHVPCGHHQDEDAGAGSSRTASEPCAGTCYQPALHNSAFVGRCLHLVQLLGLWLISTCTVILALGRCALASLLAGHQAVHSRCCGRSHWTAVAPPRFQYFSR